MNIRVLGRPAPKGSSRAILIAGRAVNVPGGSNVNRNNLRSWDQAVRQSAIAEVGTTMPFTPGEALAVDVTFRLLRPSGHWGKGGNLRGSAPTWPATKPDLDKLTRATLDSMTGIVFHDDSRIVRITARKEYATSEWPEGADIEVTLA